MRNLDVASLRSLVAILDTGGVTKAANRLNLTQSAVSMQIKRLEDALGIHLLDRGGRGVVATAEGEQLASFARRMIALNDSAVDRMVAPRYEGEVSLGIPCDVIYPQAPEVLKRFDRDYPRVRIRFVSSYTTDLLDQFARGAIDVILTTEDHPAPTAETIAQKPLRWHGAIGGRAGFQRPLSFATKRECAFRPSAVRALEAANIPWQAAGFTESEDAAVAGCSADLSVMALLEGSYPAQVEQVPTAAKLPDLPMIAINLYTRQEGPRADLAAELSRYVREAYSG